MRRTKTKGKVAEGQKEEKENKMNNRSRLSTIHAASLSLALFLSLSRKVYYMLKCKLFSDCIMKTENRKAIRLPKIIKMLEMARNQCCKRRRSV